MKRARGFPPVARPDARVLVLGSLPGLRSIAAGEYYAHPRNAFWRIAEALFGVAAALPYRERLHALADRGIALWDVLGSSRRAGSLDAAIDVASAVPNDFETFFAEHPAIGLVAFNGRKAEDLFTRLVEPGLPAEPPPRLGLPSTSPAHAAMSFDTKLERWSAIGDHLPPSGSVRAAREASDNRKTGAFDAGRQRRLT